MITIKSEAQIDLMRKAGKLLYEVECQLRDAIKPGITTLELDKMAEELIRSKGAIPSFKGYNGFPFTICASVDDQVVHGFPNTKPLKEGQVVSIDCGLILDGWQSDSAFTKIVGEGTPEAKKLVEVTEKCFWLAANQAREGNRLGDISHAVQEYAEKHGYGVIRDLCGHGIGREMHEDPNVPNFGPAGRGVKLRAGMTLAIEPMIAMGGWPVYCEDDDWTIVTRDHSICSHYEHTILITKGEPEILSYPGKTVAEVLG
jgi:methionyl aminopeptidase